MTNCSTLWPVDQNCLYLTHGLCFMCIWVYTRAYTRKHTFKHARYMHIIIFIHVHAYSFVFKYTQIYTSTIYYAYTLLKCNTYLMYSHKHNLRRYLRPPSRVGMGVPLSTPPLFGAFVSLLIGGAFGAYLIYINRLPFLKF